jgi:hypothetical protein
MDKKGFAVSGEAFSVCIEALAGDQAGMMVSSPTRYASMSSLDSGLAK